MIEYGARIRAVADYLETVPGEKYNFNIGPNRMRQDGNRCGCIVAHGFDGGIIPHDEFGPDYIDGKIWLTGSRSEFWKIINNGGVKGSGERAKQAAIKSLRAYADKNYPVTQKHTGIPDSVMAIFEGTRQVELS